MNAKATLIAKVEEVADTHQQENITASTEEPVSEWQKTVLVQCLTNILEEDHGLTVESLFTLVQSERLFSSAGCIYSERRNRLSSERAKVLLFIKSNFDLINGTYDYIHFLKFCYFYTCIVQLLGCSV